MKVTNVLGYVVLLAGTTLAAPVSENPATLLKRDGHIDVVTWSGNGCGGANQGTTAVGTSGVCVNSSNAKSIKIGGASAINPSGCRRVAGRFFSGINCSGTPGVQVNWGPNTCHDLSPNQNSAVLHCTG